MTHLLDFYIKHSPIDFQKEVDKIKFETKEERDEFIRRIKTKPNVEYKIV